MNHDSNNIMVILSSPSGAGKNYNKKNSTKISIILKYLFHTQHESQDQMK